MGQFLTAPPRPHQDGRVTSKNLRIDSRRDSSLSFPGHQARHQTGLPGGLIEEHDRRVVDQLQRDGQALPLAS